MLALNLNARNLLHWDIEDIRNLTGLLDVEFEDGKSHIYNRNQLLMDWHFWEFHRKFPNLPMLSSHSILHILKGKDYAMNTHRKLFSLLLRDTCSFYGFKDPHKIQNISKLIYEITNAIYNNIIVRAGKYVTSIDILHFIQVVRYGPIREILDTCEPTPGAIIAAQERVWHILTTDKVFAKNPLARAAANGLVNKGQILQCIAIRGTVTEVDSSYIPNPIMSNYTEGLYDPYEYTVESRSAARSLYYSEAPLQAAEYFARRLQLLTSVITKIEQGDCGTTDYVAWRVKPPTFTETGEMIYAGDLVYMQGKYYLDEETNELKEIQDIDVTLYNKVIKMRSVLKCKCRNKHHVCRTCFGNLAVNVQPDANIGHLCSATLTAQTSQSVLSIKHSALVTNLMQIFLDNITQNYFHVTPNRTGYLLKPELLETYEVKMAIPQNEAQGLIDILNVNDLSLVSAVRISAVANVEFRMKQKAEEVISKKVSINQGSRAAIMTYEFLHYAKEHRWEVDKAGNFVFDLSEWNCAEPMFKMPDMEYSFVENSNQIASMIESNMKNYAARLTPEAPSLTLRELFNLVNSKLQINIVALEVILRATMIQTKDNMDLVSTHDNPVMGIYEKTLRARSGGALMAYQGQHEVLADPAFYFGENRPDSPMDVFITPREVVEYYEKYPELV